MPIKVQNFS